MNAKRIFPLQLYIRKLLNTFVPGFFFKLSPNRYWAQNHWRSQNKGDPHGYDKYCHYHPREPVIIHEIQSRIQPENTVLDLGCNCGYYLSQLRKAGFTNLCGVDISQSAIRYGKEHLGLSDIDLTSGSFEEVIPRFVAEGKQFDLVYTLGATVELVHPSFDIINNMCRLSKRYIILIISEWGHSYPRFWEYEFNRNGFMLVKCIRPYDGSVFKDFKESDDSLMVFQRIP